MLLPTQPVTLSPEQVRELHEKLSRMRHDVAGVLSVMVAATELIRLKPERAREMINMIAEQPQKITDCVAHFSSEFNDAFGIKKS
jgi:hypothetical protein